MGLVERVFMFTTIPRASNVDGSVTSRKANLDIAVIRGEFPEEPLDTWVAQKGEVGCLGTRKKFVTISIGGIALHPSRGPPRP